MRPLNQSERNSLSFKFTAVFLVGALLAVLGIHFNFIVKEQLEQYFLSQHQSYSRYRDQERNFVKTIDSLVVMINELENSQNLESDFDSTSQKILQLNDLRDSSFQVFVPKVRKFLDSFSIEKASFRKCDDSKTGLERKRADLRRAWQKEVDEIQEKIDGVLQ